MLGSVEGHKSLRFDSRIAILCTPGKTITLAPLLDHYTSTCGSRPVENLSFRAIKIFRTDENKQKLLILFLKTHHVTLSKDLYSQNDAVYPVKKPVNSIRGV